MSKKKFIGVTTLTKRYKPEFDSDKVAGIVAEKRNCTKEEILAEWDAKRQASIARGNATHAFIEKFLVDASEFSTYMPEGHESYCTQFMDWHYANEGKYEFVRQEHTIRHQRAGVIGTIDCIGKNTETGNYVLFDWKTASKFDKTSQNRYLAPFEHLEDCHLVDYSLQLSVYKQMCINNSIDPEIDESKIECVIVQIFDDTWQEIPALDLDKEAKTLINTRIAEL